MTVTITEEFDNAQGRFANLDPSDLLLSDELKSRQHIDLRSFYADDIIVPFRMYSLGFLMGTIDTMDMTDLEGGTIYRPREAWTVGSIGPDVARGNKNTLRWTLSTGVNETESVGNAVNLALTSGSLVASFANFPGTSLTLASCQLVLSDGTSTVSLPFSGATAANGPQAVSWPLSALNGVTKPTTVRFHFVATGSATVVLGGLRVLTPEWTATKLDMDTRTQRLLPIFDRGGTVPTDAFPKLWRTSDPPGEDDPLPVDSRLAVNFYTGSMTGANQVTLFMRGRREDFLTQLDLDGTVTLDTDGTPLFGESQATLEARGYQPDYGTAVYNPRAQMDLDVLTQTDLDTDLQAQLERASDRVSESWIEATLHFGTVNKLVVGTTETTTDEERYVFPITLTANTQYLFTCDLEENSLRCFVYALTTSGSIGSPVFDSTAIINNFLLKRRLGRIGWEVVLADGDAWIDSIRSRGLSFGEVVTNNFESFTPVEGARLYAGATEPMSIPTAPAAFGGGKISVDVYNAKSTDGSFKVQAGPLQGIQTGPNVYEDFAHTQIEFDLYYPGTALRQGQTLLGALLNERGYMVPLVLPSLIGDQWQRMKIRPTQAINEQSGSYRFVILQATGTATWWVDNLDIRQRTVAWAGRSTYNDPWGRGNSQWTDFLGLINSEIDGAMFPDRGFWTQVRGRVLTQNATIEKVYTKPKYAELGRAVWNPES